MAGGKHLLGKAKGRHVFGTVKVGEKGQIVIPKEARNQFNIQPGDTLLVLGDDRHGLIVTRPDVIHDMAMQILNKLDDEEQNNAD
jgi:AbrB family looped-hinge helix DNA binding protein